MGDLVADGHRCADLEGFGTGGDVDLGAALGEGVSGPVADGPGDGAPRGLGCDAAKGGDEGGAGGGVGAVGHHDDRAVGGAVGLDADVEEFELPGVASVGGVEEDAADAQGSV